MTVASSNQLLCEGRLTSYLTNTTAYQDATTRQGHLRASDEVDRVADRRSGRDCRHVEKGGGRLGVGAWRALPDDCRELESAALRRSPHVVLDQHDSDGVAAVEVAFDDDGRRRATTRQGHLRASDEVDRVCSAKVASRRT
jgi:hypothetical protein